jgi:hypothetical protein
MSSPLIVSIVEGHGESEAVPLLLRRIVGEAGASSLPTVNPPVRIKAGSFLRDQDYFAKYIALAAAKAAQGNGAVLILLDCEDDCPAELGPRLAERARMVRNDVPFIVVLARREFETWFLAAAESLRGCCGLPADLEAPSDPESIRGAKEWLGDRMPEPYDPITHQVKFVARLNLREAARNSSFARLVKKIAAL